MILKELKNIKAREDRVKFLSDKKNVSELIELKKSMYGIGQPHYKRSDVYSFDFAKTENKMAPVTLNNNEVFVVGNSVGFMDSHDDVSLRGSWTKTAQERGNRVPILKDHNYSVNSAFAVNRGVIVTEMPIIELGYNSQGNTEVLGATIEPDEEMLMKYDKGIIKEHSVGLQYVKLALAVNNEEAEEEYRNWLSYREQVINGEKADELGYFFAVQEQKLIEISAVVFGSNSYTPAFTNSKSLEMVEPLQDTLEHEEPKAINLLKHLSF